MSERLLIGILSFSALIPAIMLHEVAHGAAALWCGDRTAKEAGRLSLNPLRHVDPFMSVILPAILALSGSRVLFGGAKPVPIDLRRCRNPMQAYWITAIAGPLCNLVQAMLGILLFKGLDSLWHGADPGSWLTATSSPEFVGGGFVTWVGPAPWLYWTLVWVYFYVCTNAMLMFFNLLPIPPLDGSRVVTVLLKGEARRAYLSMERYGLLVVFALLWFPQTGRFLGMLLRGFLRLFGMEDPFG